MKIRIVLAACTGLAITADSSVAPSIARADDDKRTADDKRADDFFAQAMKMLGK